MSNKVVICASQHLSSSTLHRVAATMRLSAMPCRGPFPPSVAGIRSPAACSCSGSGLNRQQSVRPRDCRQVSQPSGSSLCGGPECGACRCLLAKRMRPTARASPGTVISSGLCSACWRSGRHVLRHTVFGIRVHTPALMVLRASHNGPAPCTMCENMAGRPAVNICRQCHLFMSSR